MKKTFLTLLVLVLACQLPAQYRNDSKRKETVAVGIRAGGILTNYYYSDAADLNVLGYDSFMNRARPALGLSVEIPLFNGRMYVSPEVLFAQRGDSRLFESTTYDTLVRYQANVNYLEARLPLSIALPVNPNFKPYLYAAPSFGVAFPTVGPFASEIVQYSMDTPQSVCDTVSVGASNMAPYDYGVTLGAGLRFRFNFPSFSMVMKVEGGYYWGFCDTYSEMEHHDQAAAVNLNPYSSHQYNIVGKRLNRGVEASFTIAIPLEFHSSDDCFYWSDVIKKKDRSRGMFGF